jgi:hypothetical protein
VSDDPTVAQTMVRARLFAAQQSIVTELIRILILNGVLDQDLVVSSYERLSADLMKIGAIEGVQAADQVRDFAAGVERKPS